MRFAETNTMATDLQIAPAPPAEEGGDSVWTASPGGAVVLHDISWKMYRRLRKCVRITIFA